MYFEVEEPYEYGYFRTEKPYEYGYFIIKMIDEDI